MKSGFFRTGFLTLLAGLCACSMALGQTTLTFESGFTTFDDGGLAFLANSGNLAIIDQQGGGGGGATRLDIYSPAGQFLQTIPLSTGGLQPGEEFLDDGLADLPNGNVIVLTTFGNVVEVSPATGAGVANGYGGFNVLAALGGGAETSGFGWDPTTDGLWVIDDNGNPFDTLTEFSSTGTVVSGPIFALPGNLNGDAEAIAFLPGGKTMLVAEDDTNSLIEITRTGALVQNNSLAALSQGSGLPVDPDGIAVDAAGGRVFVMNKGDNTGNIMVFSIPVDQPVLGDVNGDGEATLADIAPFVELLVNGGFSENADINMDGVVDLSDIPGFVEILSN